MKTTLQPIILDFANRFVTHIRGSNYGQGPDNPANNPPAEIADIAPYITRLLNDGHQAAIARSEHDEARAAWMRETVPKIRWAFTNTGVSADELFSLGYAAYGKDR